MKQLFTKWCFIIGISLSNSLLSFSQDVNDFFVVSSRGKSTLLPAQQRKLEMLEKNGNTKSIHLVTIKNLIEHQKEGYFRFKLPGIPNVIISKADHVETNSAKDFSWSGTMVDRLGTVTLVSKDGELFGHIAVEDRKFELWPIGEKLYALTELDTSVLNSEECATVDTHVKDKNKPKNKGERFIDCSKHVRVLVLYTANAQASVPDINQTAILAVQQTNDALRNSGIFGDAYVQVGMAGPILLNFTESHVINDDVQALASNMDAQTLRNTNGADLVVLLTSSSYGATYGIVSQIGPNDATSYAIVTASAATGKYSFAHELGHLFGARHQQCGYYNNSGCDDTPGFAHGYPFVYFLYGYTTIMHQLRESFTRVPYYSNPNVSYGSPTGNAASNNNARQLWEQAPTVASFRPYTGVLSASVDIRVHYPAYGEYYCEPISVCGVAPHSYQWYLSYDGFDYGSVFSTDDVLIISPPQCTDLYVQLRIISSDNQQADHFFTLSHFGQGCEDSRIGVITSTETNEISDKNLEVFPNPIKDQVNVRYYLAEPRSTRIVLSNVQGQSLLTQQTEFQAQGWHEVTLGAIGLADGMYFMKIDHGNTSVTKKIVIKK